MCEPFFKVTRSLYQDEKFLNLPYDFQHLFMVILSLVAFKPKDFDDHGQTISLQAGQICISQRELMKYCSKKMKPDRVHRGIVKFCDIGFLQQKVQHKKSVITVIYPGLCDIIKNEDAAKNASDLQQTCSTKEESKELKKEKKKQIFMSNPTGIGLVDFFLSKIFIHSPDFKLPNKQAWAKDFDLLLRKDGRSEEKIKELIVWVTQDNFEHANVLCPQKLRKRWDQLWAKMQAEKNRAKVIPIGGKKYEDSRRSTDKSSQDSEPQFVMRDTLNRLKRDQGVQNG